VLLLRRRPERFGHDGTSPKEESRRAFGAPSAGKIQYIEKDETYSFHSLRTVLRCALRILPTSKSQQYFHFSAFTWSYLRRASMRARVNKSRARARTSAICAVLCSLVFFATLVRETCDRKMRTDATQEKAETHRAFDVLTWAWQNEQRYKSRRKTPRARKIIFGRSSALHSRVQDNLPAMAAGLNASPAELQSLEATLLNTSGAVPLHARFRALFTLKALKSPDAIRIISKGAPAAPHHRDSPL
jgi:hypothetical protein